MTFFVNLLMSEWKSCLIGTVIALLAGSLWFQTNRLDAAKKELAEIQRVANEAQQQTEANLETIRSKIPVMVEQAQSNAISNYRKRYSNLPATGCVPAVPSGVRPEGGDGQAASATVADEPTGESLAPDPEFIKACARDAGRLMLWQDLCKLNDKLCEVVE